MNGKRSDLSSAPPQASSPEDARRLLIAVGEDAQRYGASRARVTELQRKLAEAMECDVYVLSTSTHSLFAFEDPQTNVQTLRLIPNVGADFELHKLAELEALVDSVATNEVALDDALARLPEIRKLPRPWGTPALALSYALVGGGLVPLFAGNWWDAAAALPLSLLVFAMVVGVGRIGGAAASRLPLVSTFVVAALAAMTKVFVPELNVVLVTLSAVAVLLPGYTVSLGAGELAVGYIGSGWANLISGLVYLVKQAFGGWLGAMLVMTVVDVPTATAQSIQPPWVWFLTPLLIVGLCMVFQTARRDMLGASLGCIVAYLGILLGNRLGSSDIGNLLGTILLVGFARLWASVRKRPVTIFLLPGIVFLVSGTVGFRGLAAIAEGQVSVGVGLFIHMFVVAGTITFGLLIGQTLFSSKTRHG